ncbi:MAG TPA: tetratricopeptide repeat protein [Ktedonobacterales bacterium]|nr:tetratricopeptide repeat protein [Ktedonobacterales bacterium]
MRASGKVGASVASARLRQERVLRCWSQETVAEKIGTTALNVSRWERGITSPGMYFRQRLCELFEKSAAELGLVAGEVANEEQIRTESVVKRADEEIGAQVEADADAEVEMVLPAWRDWAAVFPVPSRARLVGRDDLRSLLAASCCEEGHQAVALCGLPGVGKTALAVELIYDRTVQAWFDAGVLWAPLGREPNALGLLSGWGAVLGLPPADASRLTTTDAWAMRLRALIGARRMLLVLDDVWALEDALAFTVGGPNCVHLITTRFMDIAYRFAGEHALVVRELSEEAGLALLTELAPEAVRSEPEEASTLVRSVGGLPLALALMGKYLQVQGYSGQPRRLRGALDRLGVAEERLRLALPQTPLERPRDLPAGTQLSLQAMIELSDQHLTPHVQTALRALAVFPPKPNCFSEDAALAICATAPETLDTLTDAGLLEGCGPGRYTLHQTISDYARLKQCDEAPTERMIAYYMTFVEQHALDYPMLDLEVGNVLAALELAAARRLHPAFPHGAVAVAPFLEARGLYAIAEEHLTRAYQWAQAVNDAGLLSLAWLHLGRLAELRGDLNQAEELYQKGMAAAPAGGDRSAVVRLLAFWAETAINRGGYGRAVQLLSTAMPLAQAVHDLRSEALLLRLLGEATDCKGDHAQANQYYQKGLELAREVADLEQISALLQNLGEKAMRNGEYDQAEALFHDGLAAARQLAHQQRISALLTDLGAVAHRRRRFDEARALFAESIALARSLGHKIRLSTGLLHMGQAAVEQGDEAGAARYLGESLGLAREMGHPYLLGDGLCAWSSLCLLRGQLDAADQACTEAIAVARKIHDRDIIAVAAYGLAQVARAREQPDQAQRYARHSLHYLTSIRRELVPEVQHFIEALPTVQGASTQAVRTASVRRVPRRQP